MYGGDKEKTEWVGGGGVGGRSIWGKWRVKGGRGKG